MLELLVAALQKLGDFTARFHLQRRSDVRPLALRPQPVDVRGAQQPLRHRLCHPQLGDVQAGVGRVRWRRGLSHNHSEDIVGGALQADLQGCIEMG